MKSIQSLIFGQIMTFNHTVCRIPYAYHLSSFFLYVKDMYWYSGMDLTDPMVSMVVHGGLTGVNSHDLTNSVF